MRRYIRKGHPSIYIPASLRCLVGSTYWCMGSWCSLHVLGAYFFPLSVESGWNSSWWTGDGGDKKTIHMDVD